MKRIGLSVSCCIRDIIEGKVREEDVERIIAGTMAKDEEDWIHLIAQYQINYWSRNPQEAADVCHRFIKAGKIRQPRSEGQEAPDISMGHWIESRPRMNIYALPGHRVVVTQASIYGGRESDQEKARKLLKIGKIYKVKETKVSAWHTDVFLEGEGVPFNSVTFEDAEEQPPEMDKKHPDWENFK